MRVMGLQWDPRPWAVKPAPRRVRLLATTCSKGAPTWQPSSTTRFGPNWSRHVTKAPSPPNSLSMSAGP